LRNLIFIGVFLFVVVAQPGVRIVGNSVYHNAAKTDSSSVPIAVTLTGGQNIVTTAINNTLSEWLMLEDFEIESGKGLPWYGLSFASEQKAGVLHLHLSGEYAGAYLNLVEEDLFFDLKNGALLKKKLIPLPAMFRASGYIDFLNAHWIKGCSEALAEGQNCAETEPDCHYLDIAYQLNGPDLVLSLANENCYPHALRACAPSFRRVFKKSEISSYLSDFGQRYLAKAANVAFSKLDEFLYYQQNAAEIPDMYFMVGKINSIYPFTLHMSVDQRSGSITGAYYYHSKMRDIELTGVTTTSGFELTERVNANITGYFVLHWSDYSPDHARVGKTYLGGEWKSPDGKRILPMTLDVVKRSR
jgi:hypothetical protein